MLNHHKQLVQQLGEKLTGLDEELVNLLKKSGGNAKQFTDIAEGEEIFRQKMEGDFARRRNGKIRFLRNPSGPPGKRPRKEGNDTIVTDDDGTVLNVFSCTLHRHKDNRQKPSEDQPNGPPRDEVNSSKEKETK